MSWAQIRGSSQTELGLTRARWHLPFDQMSDPNDSDGLGGA